MMIDETLKRLVRQKKDSTVRESMLYSIENGGKRLRPQMLLALVKDLKGDEKLAVHVASALEMIHTYSLIHDDLPCMDDDDFRRHKPTNHKVYGESTALLAGDGLISLAFETLANMEADPKTIKECVRILADASGINGMILGQEYDLSGQESSIIELEMTYALKTGKLFAAALEMATVLCDRSDLQVFIHLLGLKIGIAFQVQDDLLELRSNFETIGKSVTSDAKRGKPTISKFMNDTEIEKYLDDLFVSIDSDIREITDGKVLLNLISKIKARKY